MSKRWPVLCFVAVLLTFAAGHATAADKRLEQLAKRHFQQAEVHYTAGQFPEALEEYQAGYDLVPLPGFLVNIAQCQRRMGDLVQARLTYRKFILVAPDSQYVPEVEKILVELEQLIADSATPPPEAKSVPKAPTKSTDTATAQAEPASEDDGVASDDVLPAAAPATPSQPRIPLLSDSAQPEPRAASSSRWWLWGTACAVVVAAGTIAFFAVRDPGTTTLREGSLATLRR